MPTENWLQAAAQTNRQPVLMMSVESVNARKVGCSTSADWAASKEIYALDLAASPGAVQCYLPFTMPIVQQAHIQAYGLADAQCDFCHWQTPTDRQTVLDLVTLAPGMQWFFYATDRTKVGPDGATGVHVVVCDAQPTVPAFPTSTGGSVVTPAGFAHLPAGYTDLGLIPQVEGDPSIAIPEGKWVTLWRYGDGGFGYVWSEYYGISPNQPALDSYYRSTLVGALIAASTPGAYLQTKTLDLGVVPVTDSVLSLNAPGAYGATLAVTGRGSADGTTWTDLVNLNQESPNYNTAALEDGAQIAPYRYYDFKLVFTSDGLSTPVVRSLMVSGGDAQRTVFSTHEETPPGSSALPLLLPDLGALSSKIELMKLGSIGEVAPKLYYLQPVFEMIRDGYLRNKAVVLKLGFDNGMGELDYEPLFTGLWYDGAVDLYRGTVPVKTRTPFSMFSKANLPAEEAPGTYRSALNVPVIEWFSQNIMQVMLEVLSLMGLAGRYVNTASFTALSAPGGARSGTDWNVSRRIDKDNKVAAITLLEELSVLSGVFLLQLPNGQVTASLYDATAPIVTEIGADMATFSQVALGQGTLYTRQQILYNPKHVDDIPDGVAWGSWAAQRSYIIGDMVIDVNGAIWHCYVAHTSDNGSLTSNQPGVGPDWRSYWVPRWTLGGRYQTAGASVPASQVVHNGTIYTCTASNTANSANEPGVGAGWASCWSAGGAITVPAVNPWDWASAVDYSRADSVYYLGVLYRCLTSHKSDSTNAPLVGANRRAYWATEWLSGVAYSAGDTVTRNGPLFTCRGGHTSSLDDEPYIGAHWSAWWTTSPVKTNPGDQDFYCAFVQINAQAEINWGLNADVPPEDPDYLVNPGYQYSWQEKWNATSAARSALATRMDGWFANPKMQLKASDLPPRFWAGDNGEEIVGAMVGVTGLMLPSRGSVWGTTCVKKKFLVMSKTLDPAKLTVSLDLLEVGTAAAITGVNPAQLRGNIVLNSVQLVLGAGNPFYDGDAVVVEWAGTGIDGSYTAKCVDAVTIELVGLNLTAPIWSGQGTVYLSEV